MNIEFYLRKVTLEDAEILFKWRNESSTRNSSFNDNLIEYDSHLKWLSSTLNNPNIVFFILECNRNSVGQIRLNINSNVAEISYSIGESFRGYGYGRKILTLIEDTVNKYFGNIVYLKALVKKENVVSSYLFKSLNYVEIEYNEYFEYKKCIR